MEIREIAESELNDLLSLYSHLHASDEPVDSADVAEATWSRIQADPRIRYFGVYLDQQLVAACTICVIPNLTRGCRPYGIIENVVTHADFRREGHGSAVLKRALQYAWSQGCYKVMLLTGRKDEGIYQFYESAGFNMHAKQAFVVRREAEG